MALEGTLRDFSFADILQLISLQRKTGVLTLKNEENVVTISFLDGCIVGSSSLSQHPEDRIGLILLKRGHITENELDAALRKQEETLQRLGRILIDHHLVEAGTVRHALEQQILQIIYRVFRWADGEYHFSQETDIDYDRDLMVPMAADSIIMEGARMTDEWPFIDQRIPDREVVFIQVNPEREFEVVDEADDDFDDLGFNFTDLPEEKKPPVEGSGERLTPQQFEVYQQVNGRDSVADVILESAYVEFDTCKVLADLLDRGLIRQASQDEVVRELRREVVPVKQPGFGLGAVPWLAVPFLALLGFSLTVMFHNPANPGFSLHETLWNDRVLESVSWFWMNRLARAAETDYYLKGIYPESADDVTSLSRLSDSPSADPWGRRYRLVTRGGRMMLTGSDSSGYPVPALILSRSLAWEGDVGDAELLDRPGVRLID